MKTNERSEMVYRTSAGRVVHEETALMEIKVTYEDGTVEFVPYRARTIADAIRTAMDAEALSHGEAVSATFTGRYIEEA